MVKKNTKRLFDLVLATAFILLGWPVILTLSLAVLFTSGWPIFFCQQRIGEKGRPFFMFKFKTMRRNSYSKKAMWRVRKDDPRLTFLGRLIRPYGLDEIPQLINVWRGEMSLVGPRPLLLEEINFLKEHYPSLKRQDNTPPGILGLAQILVGHFQPAKVKQIFLLEETYSANWSLKNDLKILLFGITKTFLHGH